MRGFPQNAVCVVGLSKAPSQNPITFVHQSLIGSFVVDNTTGRIYAVQFNTVTDGPFCRKTDGLFCRP